MAISKQTKHKQFLPSTGSIKTFLYKNKYKIGIFLIAFFVLFLRRPDVLLNAQFWAEDAKWFQDAVNNNYLPHIIFESYAGYMVVVQRIAGFLSGIFPLELSPLFFNIYALSIQALLVVYLWSNRVTFISKNMKISLSVIYLVLPYTQEIHANVTNSQWFLGILLFLLVFMKTSESKFVLWCERVVIAIASLSGPFSIFLSPILLFELYRKKKYKNFSIKNIDTRYLIVFAGAFVQVVCLLLTRESQDAVIGYSITKFFQIISGQIFWAGLFGTQSLGFVYSKPWIAPVVTIIGIQMMIYVFIKSSTFLRYFIVYATFIFAAALVSTLGTPPGYTWWYYFTTEAFGGRYYLFMHLAMFAALSWIVLTKENVPYLLRGFAGVIIAASLLIGVPADFQYKPYKDFHYQDHIKKYREAEKGEKVTVPVNPGEFWKAVLKKD